MGTPPAATESKRNGTEELGMDPLTSGAWLIEKIRGWAADAVLEKFKPKVDLLQENLAHLNRRALEADQKSDDALIAPLREGIRRWQLGDLDEAINRFFEAEARNPFAPVPRILLAFACATRTPAASAAQTDIVNDLLKGAASLSPYSVEPWIDAGGDGGLQRLFQDDTDPGAEPQWAPRSYELDSFDVIREIGNTCGWPKLPFWKTLDPSYRPRSTSAIARASVCGASAVIEWLIADHLLNRVETALVLFRLDTGNVQWGRLATNEQLLFATYQHVIVRDQDGRIALLNLATGDPDIHLSAR
jgi:hypothetical protein